MPTPALINMEKMETMELMLTICGQSGSGLSWCARSVATSPSNANRAKIQLHVSAVQPFLQIRDEPLDNRVQPRPMPRGIALIVPKNVERHPLVCSEDLFVSTRGSFAEPVMESSRRLSSGLEGGGGGELSMVN